MPVRNPHEETRQAAQNWSPREQYISRSNQDRMHDATVNRFIQESQGNQQRWEQGGGQGAYPVFNQPGTGANSPVSPGWLQASSGLDNSGIMTADAGNVMNKYKQFTEKFGDFDIGRDGIEYEKDFDVPWGGTGTFEGWGGGDDYGAGINFNWPLGQSAALDDRGGNWLSRIGGALKDEFFGGAKAAEINPERVLASDWAKQPVNWKDLDPGMAPINARNIWKKMQEDKYNINTMGDLYNYINQTGGNLAGETLKEGLGSFASETGETGMFPKNWSLGQVKPTVEQRPGTNQYYFDIDEGALEPGVYPNLQQQNWLY